MKAVEEKNANLSNPPQAIPSLPTQDPAVSGSEIPSTSPASTIDNDSSKPSKKLLATILAVVIILFSIGSAASYFVMKNMPAKTEPTPLGSPEQSTEATDPTADWKTYENSQQGYSIKHPDNWNLESTNSQLVSLLNYDSKSAIPSDAMKMEVSAAQSTQGMFDKFIQDRVNSYQNNSLVSNIVHSTGGSYKIDSLDTEQITLFNNSTKDYVIELHAFKENKRYAMVIYHKSSQIDPIINQIISTFKFMDSTTATKTYTNQTLGFSFKYPQDWKINEPVAGEGSCDGTQIKSPSQKSQINICKVDNAGGLVSIKNEKKIEGTSLELTIDGHNGYGHEIQAADSQYGYSFFLENSSKRDLLWFLAASDLTEKETIRNLLDQILSTFKFTK